LQLAQFAIANLYVDQVDDNKLVESAIKGMLEELDPHSTYSTPEEVKRMNEPLQGNFDGIGIQFNMAEDTLFVIQPVSGGPSEKVGILAGDRIVEVNDTVIAGVKMSTEDVMRRLKGPKGTLVDVKVLRRGVPELLSFTIRRDKIPVYSLDASYMIAPQTGYIKINRFAATTHAEFMNALATLKSQGMKDLILDLQGNGGGYLNAAIDIANEFLGDEELIVYTEGRRSARRDFYADGNGKHRFGKLVVLVDEYSASASEIVSGAVQDWDRGMVVGRRTFGKGLVQRPIDLPDGSMIRLTISRYYTPAGRCIQKPYENTENYAADLIERYNRGEMMSADSIHFPDSLKCTTLKKGRTVYGGGGIMPDYFVPVDTTLYTDYHRQISYKGVLLKVHYQLIDAYRKDWNKKYKDYASFAQKFEMTEPMMQRLKDEAAKAGIAYNEEQYRKSESLLKLQLKALIARDLWDMNEYYHTINVADESVKKALELLKE
jgi:carboxyl-terminal processing protease